MAANYTRQIEFKVNDRAIKQSTDRLVRSLTRIEKKLDVIANGFKKVEKNTRKIGLDLEKTKKTIVKSSNAFWEAVKATKRLGENIHKFRHNFELTEKAIAAIARGGGLAHLRTLLGEAVKAQDALLVSNSGYIQSLQATRQIQGEINQELIARQRILDGLNRSEGLTAGPGLTGLTGSRSEQKGILDRMLTTQSGYVEQAKRVKQVEKLINEELKARDKIMNSLLTKQERLAKMGARVKDVAGKGAQFMRPGGRFERRGMGLGVAAGIGGAGLGVNALSNWASQGMGAAGGDPFATAITKAASGMTLGTIKGSAFLTTLKGIGIALAKINPQLLGLYAALYLAFGKKTNSVIGGTINKLTSGMWGLSKSLAQQHNNYLALNADLGGINQKFELSATAAKKFEIALNGVARAQKRLAQTRRQVAGSGFRAFSEQADRIKMIHEAKQTPEYKATQMRRGFELRNERIGAKRELQRTRGLKIEERINEVLKRRGKIMMANGQVQDIQNKKGIFKGGAGGALSSAMIGGGFPLLFGQGGASAVGGGIGGLAGGAIGGGFGFGLSIVGTALGQAYQKNLEFNRSLAVLNIRLKDTGDGSAITAKEIDALAKKMNITKQEAMGVLSAFSQFDEKGVRMSLTDMFGEDVGTYKTISEGARTQGALAEKIFEARHKIGNAKAEELLKQNLVNKAAVVELALAKAIALENHNTTVEKARQIGFMDHLNAAMVNATRSRMDKLTGQNMIDPIVFAERRVKKLQEEFEKNKAKNAENFVKSLEEIRKLMGLVKDGVNITDTLEKIDSLYQQIGQTINDGIVNAIEGAIQGTKTLGEVASSVFRSIARMLLQYGVSTFMGSLFPNSESWQKFFGGTKAMAAGGPVSGNKSYLVGEKGPELFTPTSSGTITPNHALGGSNIVVNVDASGSSVEGDDQGSQQLGEMLAAAIQSELVKQKRPGGILS